MTTTETETSQPAASARAVDPAAELIRAALDWCARSPSVGEAHANLMRAADLYRKANQPNREDCDERERD